MGVRESSTYRVLPWRGVAPVATFASVQKPGPVSAEAWPGQDHEVPIVFTSAETVTTFTPARPILAFAGAMPTTSWPPPLYTTTLRGHVREDLRR